MLYSVNMLRNFQRRKCTSFELTIIKHGAIKVIFSIKGSKTAIEFADSSFSWEKGGAIVLRKYVVFSKKLDSLFFLEQEVF